MNQEGKELPGPSDQNVNEWLAAQNDAQAPTFSCAGSDVGGELGVAMSRYGDDVSEVADYVREALGLDDVSSVDEETAASVSDALLTVAYSEQRMVAATCRRKYVRGRVHLDYTYGPRPLERQRLVMMNKYMQITSLEDNTLFEKLKNERVVTRLGAPTGLGKTTKLPGLIASRCGLRVCLVLPDAHLAKSALETQRAAYGIAGSSRRWTREKSAFLCAISYEDFRGLVQSNGRKRFFSDFDVFMFDEPHLPLASVWLAKQFFAIFGQEHNSLLLMSATISTNSDNDLTASGVGSFVDEPVRGGMSKLLASDALSGKYLTDRTMVLVGDNRRVNSVREYYIEVGVDVRTLDTGSSIKDVENVQRWLAAGDVAVPRVLIADESYGTGYNFSVSYVVTSATRVIHSLDGHGGLVEQEVPLRDVEVKQHKGRTGRGMTVGSGGVVASVARDTSHTDLLRCEMLKAYLGLVAADVEPRSGLFDEVFGLIPKGLNRDAAIALLSIELPPALVLRYLGSDGCVARRFVNAMSLYLQPDHSLLPSKDYDPVGYSDWIPEVIGGYYEGDSTRLDKEVFVPFSSPASLKAIMHTLYAVSQRWIDVPRWQPEGYGDSASDDEELGVRDVTRKKKKPVQLRMIATEKELPRAPVSETTSWTFDVDKEKLAKRSKRDAMSWLGDKDSSVAIEALRDRAEKRRSFGSVTADVERHVNEGSGLVDVYVTQGGRETVDVESPGGTVKMKLNESLYEDLVNAQELTPGVLLELVGTISKIKEGFVKSTLFDNYSNVWISILKSLSNKECVRHVVRHGKHSAMVKLLGYMYDRYRAESIAVCSTSNLYRKQLRKFFSSGAVSMTKLQKHISKGNMPIAQSDGFIQRMMQIGEGHSQALRNFEECSVYAPHLATEFQARLPVQLRSGVMPVVGEEVIEGPSSVRTWKGG